MDYKNTFQYDILLNRFNKYLNDNKIRLNEISDEEIKSFIDNNNDMLMFELNIIDIKLQVWSYIAKIKHKVIICDDLGIDYKSPTDFVDQLVKINNKVNELQSN